MFYKIYRILKLGSSPATVVYPYPIVPFLAFAISKATVADFIISLVYVFAYCTAVNLWNHINDAEIDVKFGDRNELLILLQYKREAIAITIFLYLLAFFVVLAKTNTLVTLCYTISVIITWLYSDRIWIGKYIRRLKENYILEIVTYSIVLPLSSIVLWCFFSELNYHCIVFSTIITVVLFSSVMLKDIKDISADLQAGYKTLAIVLPPEKLLQISLIFSYTYYILLFIFSCTLCLFPKFSAIGLFPLLLLIYSTFNLHKKSWEISYKTIKFIKIFVYSYVASLILMSAGAFYENFI